MIAHITSMRMMVSTTCHVLYPYDSPITWCSQKQEIVALSSCEAEFMAATEAAKQAIWLQELLGEVVGKTCEKVKIMVDNKLVIALIKNSVFHGRSKNIHRRFHLYVNVLRKSKMRWSMYQEVNIEQRY